MAKIYISSTYSDLAAYREQVYQVLRQMRHDAIGMEDYVATDQRPLDKCLADVSSCDLYLGLFAWRYGYLPPKDNPDHHSITELEYRTAIARNIPCLIFLLKDGAPWPTGYIDALTGEGESGKRIRELRQELAEENTVSFFETPDELARLAGAAVHLWEDKRKASSTRPSGNGESLPWNVPFQRNPLFTGREDILTRLHDALQGHSPTALTQTQHSSTQHPQAISGLGGIGKTQTALEYTYRYRKEYQAVLWVRAATRETLITDLVAIAALLGLPEKDAQDQTLALTAVKRWLVQHSGWLLILDNADDLSLVADLLSAAGQGHILLTTRAQSMGRLAGRIDIDTMGSEEGALFLLHRANLLPQHAPLSQASAAAILQAKEIVQTLAGLPLALDQAGAYIEDTACSLSDYLDLYRKRRADLLKRRGGMLPDHPEPVATTWSLSFEKVQQVNPAAADLLRLCAFLHPDAIPEEIITEGSSKLSPSLASAASDPFEWNATIEALLAYSLVRRDAEAKTLTIHRLVQAVLKDSMEPETQHEWAVRTVQAVNQAFPDVEYSTWQRCERLLPHALTCLDLIEQWTIESQEAGRLLNQAAIYLWDRARYPEAESLYRRAIAIGEKTLGAEHPDVATYNNNLAALYWNQGKYAEAEPLYRRAIAIGEKERWEPSIPMSRRGTTTCHPLSSSGGVRGGEWAEEHPTSEAVQQPGHALLDQGKYAEAEPLYRRAIAIGEKTLGAGHPDVAKWYNNLAALYEIQGKYAEAEPLFRRAIAIGEKALGAEHPDVAT